MKTKKALVTVFAVALSVITTATEKPKTNVQSLNANQVLVTIQSERATGLEVSILNEDGDIVYFKQSRKPITSFNKIFDVNNLENGKYSLKLNVNGLILKRDLELTSDKINIGNLEEYSTPYFVYNGKELTISHLNFNREKFGIEIYNNNEMVYKTTIGNESPINSGFDLSKLEAGNYRVILDSAKDSFTYQFEK